MMLFSVIDNILLYPKEFLSDLVTEAFINQPRMSSAQLAAATKRLGARRDTDRAKQYRFTWTSLPMAFE